MSNDEDSFVSSVKSTSGVLVVLFTVFVVAPCAMCGGMATCGQALENVEEESSEETGRTR